MRKEEHRAIVADIKKRHAEQVARLEAGLPALPPHIIIQDNPATLGQMDDLQTANNAYVAALEENDRKIAALTAFLRACGGEDAVTAAYRLAGDLARESLDVEAEARAWVHQHPTPAAA